jgi:AcrR family transcriptional regulator
MEGWIVTKKQQSESTRTRILEAALQLFSTKGFSATSTKTIAQAAGVSEGLIFHHFGNKLQLLMALKTPERSLGANLERIAMACRDLPASRFVEEVVLKFMALVASDGRMLNLLLSESRINNELFEAFNSILTSALESLTREFNRREATGERCGQGSPETRANAILGALMLYFIMQQPRNTSTILAEGKALAKNLALLAE